MHTKVGIVMGARTQWSTIQHTAKLLAHLGIAYEARIITANKSSRQLHEYASNAISRGLEIIIAGSTGKTYIPGIIASKTEVPVVDVQINHSTTKKTVNNSNSENNIGNTIKMPHTGTEGAINAALFAASILANKYPHIHDELNKYCSQIEFDNTLQESSI